MAELYFILTSGDGNLKSYELGVLEHIVSRSTRIPGKVDKIKFADGSIWSE